MTSTFWGLGIGLSGLYVNQTGLNTTSHNISNANTTGYTRQVANQSASTPISTNNTSGMAGTGVVITSVNQIRSAYYDSKYRENNAISGEYSTKSEYMSEIQNYFNELDDTGFTETFDNFYDALQEVADNPSDSTARNTVIGYGKTFAEYFNSVAENLSSTQSSLNFEVKNQVDKINTLASQIATLNQQINRVEINGENANDLRDTRNELVDELSQIANVSTVETKSEDGAGLSTYRVLIDGNVLVDTSDYNSLKVVPRSDEDKVNQSDIDGLYDIEWVNGNDFNISSPTLTGTLKALIDVRDGNNNENLQGSVSSSSSSTSPSTITISSTNINDIAKLNIPTSGKLTVGNQEYSYSSFAITQDATTGEYSYTFSLDEPLTSTITAGTTAKVGDSIDYKGIPYYMSKMNEFVRTYAATFNTIEKSGEDLNGDAGLDFFNAVDPTTGLNYTLSTDPTTTDSSATSTIIESSYYNLTAANITITSDLLNDPSKFAAAGTDINQGVEDNSVVEELLALKDGKAMFKQGSPSEFLESFVADIGVDTDAASNFAESQTNILNSVTNQRLSVSGVDTDEEATNLIKYQQCYNLCSKVISVMNEVLDKLINDTGV